LFEGPLHGCRRFLNLLECAESHRISEQYAQKQQHRSVKTVFVSLLRSWLFLVSDHFVSIKSCGNFVCCIYNEDGI